MNLSVNTLKKNLRWIVCAALGLLHFILLFLPYLSMSVSYLGVSQSETASGYDTLNGDGLDSASLGFCVFCQVVTLIVAIVLLVGGVYILLKKLLNLNLPETFGPVNVKQVTAIVHLTYAGLTILSWLSFLFVGIEYSQSVSGAKLSIGPGVGAYLAMILGAGSVVGLYYLEKKLPGFTGGPSKKYVCSQCGAPSKAGVAFCGKCGGQVTEVVELPTTYVCSACGAPSKAGVAFCGKCGNPIIEVQVQPEPVYVCENCGASSQEGTAFCGKCGGKIIQK